MRFGSWKVGSLTGRSGELAQRLKDRKINVGFFRNPIGRAIGLGILGRNSVEMVLHTEFHNGIVEGRKVNQRFSFVKTVWRGLIFT